jgi:small subunit ribosomal protein S16
MAVVIRLMRAGAKKRPFYRLVAADSRRSRDGRFLEILGHYNPIAQPFELVVQKDQVQKWLDQGARPSEQEASLLLTAPKLSIEMVPDPENPSVEFEVKLPQNVSPMSSGAAITWPNVRLLESWFGHRMKFADSSSTWCVTQSASAFGFQEKASLLTK